uniref:Uncharacterized protein n=1 Tax=Oryza punctata TaxID=4537 RepID=A0A0E0MCH6_ORYPU
MGQGGDDDDEQDEDELHNMGETTVEAKCMCLHATTENGTLPDRVFDESANRIIICLSGSSSPSRVRSDSMRKKGWPLLILGKGEMGHSPENKESRIPEMIDSSSL